MEVSVFDFWFVFIYEPLNALIEKEVLVLNDKKTISAILNRDEQVLASVVQRYSRLLWKVASPILTNAASSQEIEECVADVFIYLWQHPEKYDPNKAKLASWLSVIAKSRAIDRYRRIIKTRELSMEEIVVESLGYDEIAEIQEEKERLRSCIDELSETEKELIVRRYYHEQKPAEIAAVLNIPKKQVENKLYHAKQRLKKMMER